MGMFDTIKVERKIDGKSYKDIDFQTKSLNNMLDYYIIDRFGYLTVFKYDIEETVPKFFSQKKGIEKFIEEHDKNYKRVNERLEPYYFHGTIHFYSYSREGDNNKDFVALYSQNKLIGIYPATENGIRIYKDAINGCEFLALNELGNDYSEFIKKYSPYTFNFYIENEKINKILKKVLKFFHINTYIKIKGIFYSNYLQYCEERNVELLEYMEKNPIITHKRLTKAKNKKKVKKEKK
jgi:hypothetical protein